MCGDSPRNRRFIGFSAIALSSCLTSACGSLGAGGGAVQSVQLAAPSAVLTDPAVLGVAAASLQSVQDELPALLYLPAAPF